MDPAQVQVTHTLHTIAVSVYCWRHPSIIGTVSLVDNGFFAQYTICIKGLASISSDHHGVDSWARVQTSGAGRICQRQYIRHLGFHRMRTEFDGAPSSLHLAVASEVNDPAA